MNILLAQDHHGLAVWELCKLLMSVYHHYINTMGQCISCICFMTLDSGNHIGIHPIGLTVTIKKNDSNWHKTKNIEKLKLAFHKFNLMYVCV